MMSFEQDDFDENEQPCCLNPDIFTNDDGIRVCWNCGMTFGQTFVDSERRAYTSEEVLARRRTEPKWRSFGPRTVITNINADARDMPLNPKNRRYFRAWPKFKDP